MKIFVCFLAICVAVAYCDVKDKSHDHDKAYGSEKKYGKENKYGYESQDKAGGYHDDTHKKVHGSKKEYGQEKEYGYQSKDKSFGHDDDYHNKKAYGSEKEHGKEKRYGYESDDKSYSRGDYGHGDYSKDKSFDVKHNQGVAYNKQYIYHGNYHGHCGEDGFYYRDHSSFVVCSNNNAYVQPCAPGSRNSGHDNYNYGDNYYYRDFCDVNLVDHGYGAKGNYGYDADAHYRGAYDSHDGKSYGHGSGYRRGDGAYGR